MPWTKTMKTDNNAAPQLGREMLIEALRAAHELCAYLVNNMEADGDEAAPNIEFGARTLAHAEQFAALVNDARDKAASALVLVEVDLAAITLRNLVRPHS